MLDRTKDVQGVAVYAEFIRGVGDDGPRMMMILTPDGYDSEGAFVGAGLYRRVVSAHSPKKQWKFSPMPSRRVSAEPVEPIADDERDAVAEDRMRFATALFDGLKAGPYGAWRPVGALTFVEVSKRDLDDVRYGKTPTKVVYRINQTREAAKPTPAPAEYPTA